MIIKKIFADGYERLLTIEINGQVLFVSSCDFTDYETMPQYIDVVEKNISGKFHLKYSSVVEAECFGVMQPTYGSPSTILTGILTVIDDDNVTVSTDMLGDVLIELEKNYIHGNVFQGELFIEYDTST